MIDIKLIRITAKNTQRGDLMVLHRATVIDMCDEIERLRSTINEFHHAVKDAGWHPGRTDDLLTDIIRAKGVELATCRKDAARYQWIAWKSDTNPIMPINTETNRLYFGYECDAAIDEAMESKT